MLLSWFLFLCTMSGDVSCQKGYWKYHLGKDAFVLSFLSFSRAITLCFDYNCIVSLVLTTLEGYGLWVRAAPGAEWVFSRPAAARRPRAASEATEVVFSWLLHKKVLCLSVCAQLTFLILFFISLVVYAWLPKLHWVHYGFLAGTKDNRGTWG